MTGKRICICKVCRCGRNKCIHKDVRKDVCQKVARKSSSRHSFGGFEKHHDLLDFGPPVLQKPKDQLPIPLGKMDLCYQEEYVPMPLPAICRPSDAKYFPPTKEFSKDTEYRTHFVPKPIDPPKSMKPPALYQPSLPFTDLSTYQKSYRPLNLAEILKYRTVSMRPPNLWEGTPEFADRSLYQDDFRCFPEAQRATSFRPRLAPLPDIPFDGKSVYNDTFVPKPLPSIKPSVHKDKSGLLQTESGLKIKQPISIAKGDYIPYLDIPRVRSAHPPPKPPGYGDEPISGATTYRDDYWARPIELRQLRRECLPPLSDRTYESRKCKSPYFTFADDTAYRTTTTTKSAFKLPPSGSGPPKSYKPLLKYIPTKNSFEKFTTFTSSYKGEYLPPSKPFKQWESEWQNRVQCLPMSTRTEYTDRFRTNEYWKRKIEEKRLGTKDLDNGDHDEMECCCRYCKCYSEDVKLENVEQNNIIQGGELIEAVC